MSHSVSSTSPPKPFKLEDRFRKSKRLGASIRALNEAGNYCEHFAFLDLDAAPSNKKSSRLTKIWLCRCSLCFLHLLRCIRAKSLDVCNAASVRVF